MKYLIRAALIVAFAVGVAGISSVAQAGDKADKTKDMRGHIESIDAKANTITIKHKKNSEPKTFKIAADTSITGEGEKAVKLTDLKVGEHVTVLYTVAGADLVANHISISKEKSEK